MELTGDDKINSLKITQADREWVEQSFLYLVKIFGIPLTSQLSLSEKDFPHSFKERQGIKIESLIADFCIQLKLERTLFSYEIFRDLRDSVNLPYSIEGRPVDCYLEFIEKTGKYKIAIAHSIFEYPAWLVSALSVEFSKVRLIQSRVKLGEGTVTNLTLNLAAIYFGYGVIFGHNFFSTGISFLGGWEKRWRNLYNIPYPVIAYTLAIFAKLKNDLAPAWREFLADEIKIEFDSAIEYLRESDNILFDLNQIIDGFNPYELFKYSQSIYRSGDINKAIIILQALALKTTSNEFKAAVYNNIGYYRIRLGQYENSISEFKISLNFNPNYGFANDNIGFALIMLNKPEEGIEYLDRAIETGNNNMAYSYRNMALYYQKMRNYKMAEDYFHRAFDIHTSVDLLNYFFGLFLLDTGEKEKGIEQIKISANNGEIEGKELIKKLK